MNVLCKRVDLLDRNPDYDPDFNLDRDPNNFALLNEILLLDHDIRVYNDTLVYSLR